MWAPADINALPTKEYIYNARQAIFEKEEELAEALRLLEQAQLRVTTLEKELYERKAWIAPIRKLGFDVLSLIFERCSENDWKAPLHIGAVSRSWQTTVLATARAWSIVDLTGAVPPQVVLNYLERSGACLIHTSVPQSERFLLSLMLKKIECIFLREEETRGKRLYDMHFPNVKRVKVNNYYPASFFTVDRFPALKHLLCQNSFENPNYPPSNGPIKGFAPLHTLEIKMLLDQGWYNVLESCSSTLRFLKLTYICHPLGDFVVNLPRLICLQVDHAGARTNYWSLELKTPLLKSYIEQDTTFPYGQILHRDLGTVTHMRLGRMRPLLQCKGLKHLQIANREELIYPVLKSLAENAALCPDLETIEVLLPGGVQLDEEDIFESMEEITVRQKRPLVVIYPRRLSDNLPGFIPHSVSLPSKLDFFSTNFIKVRQVYAL